MDSRNGHVAQATDLINLVSNNAPRGWVLVGWFKGQIESFVLSSFLATLCQMVQVLTGGTGTASNGVQEQIGR
jgi:hypothetical protein